jgi:hypothetical protein
MQPCPREGTRVPSRAFSKYLVLVPFILIGVAGSTSARVFADWFFRGFSHENLIVSRSVYSGTASTVTIGESLPPNCGATAGKCVKAVDNGSYPALGSAHNVWNNAPVDGSFGVTSPIFLDEITPDGRLVRTLDVPTNQIVTSFSSKSEVALNLSQDGKYITFMGYITSPNAIDVSNSNTPGVVDPTNPVGENVYRAVAQLDARGRIKITETNAYSGNNGRAAILAHSLYYTTGNSNNGSGTPQNIITSTGVELVIPGQAPGTPTQIGNFSITQVVDPTSPTGAHYGADKAGKDNNFRGLTIYDNTLYVTKGSGGNGINTVYQVGKAGTLPKPTDNLPNVPITVLPGLPTTLAKNADARNPFGIWFANATTLYVADEGDSTAANAATSKFAGLEKWSLVNGTWKLDYVLQDGLNLGQKYAVDGYPAALDPQTDGLRNITGRVNHNGTVTIWGVTSTVSANGDQGADPNKLVKITDRLSATTLPTSDGDDRDGSWEHFVTIRSASYGEVLRGVAFAPRGFFEDEGRDRDEHERDRDGRGGDDHGDR